MDRFTSMQVFQEVARRGSFAAAAEHLDMSRAMVTRHVAALEEHLAVRLLNRTTRRLSLTGEGETYLARCQHILEELEYAESSIGEMKRIPRGRLRITAPVAYGAYQLTPLVCAFMQAQPAVRAELLLNDRLPDLAEDGIDVAVWVGELDDSGLFARPFARMRLVACAAPEYLARVGTPSGVEDLAALNCLRYAYRPRPDIWRFTGPDGEQAVAVEGDFEANTGEALRIAALSGRGVVLLPGYMVREDIAAGRLLTVLPAMATASVPIQALYLHRRHLSAKVRSFVDFLVANGDTPDSGPATGL